MYHIYLPAGAGGGSVAGWIRTEHVSMYVCMYVCMYYMTEVRGSEWVSKLVGKRGREGEREV